MRLGEDSEEVGEMLGVTRNGPVEETPLSFTAAWGRFSAKQPVAYVDVCITLTGVLPKKSFLTLSLQITFISRLKAWSSFQRISIL